MQATDSGTISIAPDESIPIPHPKSATRRIISLARVTAGEHVCFREVGFSLLIQALCP
uniref:Uncharacterized protein n=1 Tax=mine drainage metagenome TaxID=410659 RepID=E6PYM0_9ZZZZ